MSFCSRHKPLISSPRRRLTGNESPGNEPKPTAPAVPPNLRKRVCLLLTIPSENLLSIPSPRWRCHPVGRPTVPGSPRQRVFRRCRRDKAAARVHHAFWRACPHSTQARLGSYLPTIRGSHPQPIEPRNTHAAGLAAVQPLCCRWGLPPSPNPGAGPHAGPDPRQRSRPHGLQFRSRWPSRSRAR